MTVIQRIRSDRKFSDCCECADFFLYAFSFSPYQSKRFDISSSSFVRRCVVCMGIVMYICLKRAPRRGNKPIAQGIALGVKNQNTNAPSGQNHSSAIKAFALSGRSNTSIHTQGGALGYRFAGLSGRLFPYFLSFNCLTCFSLSVKVQRI